MPDLLNPQRPGAIPAAPSGGARVGILVRDVRFQRPLQTTTLLALAGLRLGHSVHLFGVGDLSLDGESGALHAQAVKLSLQEDASALCHRLLEGALPQERIDLRRLDLLLLRFNPAATDGGPLPWQIWWPALAMAEALHEAGVPVVNAPAGLRLLLSKLHLSQVPADCVWRGLVTRSPSAVERYWQEQGPQPLIGKPLVGSGGSRVFLLEPGDVANRDQILETLCEGGYAMVQRFLPQGREGDKRVLLLDGEPLVQAGRVAVYRRRAAAGRLRNNMHAGAQRQGCELSPAEERCLSALGPWLRARGLRFVGVDLLAERVLEINGLCPGGIGNIDALYGLDLGPEVLRRLLPVTSSAVGGRGA